MIVKCTCAILFTIFSLIMAIVSIINIKQYDNFILVCSLVINCLVFMFSIYSLFFLSINSGPFKILTIVLSISLIVAAIFNGLGQNNLHITHHIVRSLILMIYIFIIYR